MFVYSIIEGTYHQQQNKWYPPKVFTYSFRSYTLLYNSDFTCTYLVVMLLYASKFATA